MRAILMFLALAFALFAVRAVMRLRGGRPIKELSGDAQCADAITGSPHGADFVGLAIHLSSGANSQTASALA
jgi:hypothetical protein